MYTSSKEFRDKNIKIQHQKLNTGAIQFKDKRVENLINNGLQKSILQGPRLVAQRAQIDTISNTPPVQKEINNTGLPNNLKSGIENLSGIDMSDTRVHYNSPKPAQLQAHAYAQGNQIHIASGQEKHLPHEAWHVVQQKQGRVKPTMQMKGKVAVNDDANLEREADVMGAKALSSRNHEHIPTKNSMNSFHIIQPKWISQDESTHLIWDAPIDGYRWYYNPSTDTIYNVLIATGEKSSEHSYMEWLKAGWLGFDNQTIAANKADLRPETTPERGQRRRNQEHARVTGTGGPHDALLSGGFSSGDLLYGPAAERRPYLTSPAAESPGRVPNPRHKIVNPYNAAWYPGDLKEKQESKHRDPRTWEEAMENALTTAAKSGDREYTTRSSVNHLKIFREYYNKPGENDAYPIKDDSDAERQKGWRRGSKAGIKNTVKNDGQKIHFVLDGLNLKDVFDKSQAKAKSVTSTELRFIFRNWHDADFRKGVTFYKNNAVVPAPWEDSERAKRYTAAELLAMGSYKPKGGSV